MKNYTRAVAVVCGMHPAGFSAVIAIFVGSFIFDLLVRDKTREQGGSFARSPKV